MKPFEKKILTLQKDLLLLKEMHLTISAERNQNPSKILLKDTK
jgi:hypothetical protein